MSHSHVVRDLSSLNAHRGRAEPPVQIPSINAPVFFSFKRGKEAASIHSENFSFLSSLFPSMIHAATGA